MTTNFRSTRRLVGGFNRAFERLYGKSEESRFNDDHSIARYSPLDFSPDAAEGLGVHSVTVPDGGRGRTDENRRWEATAWGRRLAHLVTTERPEITDPETGGRRPIRYSDVAILMLTTETDGAKKQRAKQQGATGWLNKPFNEEKMLSTIARVLA